MAIVLKKAGERAGNSAGNWSVNVSDVTVSFVSRIVSELTGVQLGPSQSGMVRSRVLKHLLELGLSDADYAEFFRQNKETETQALISLLTTHHSYFFREYSHFEYLETVTLPALVNMVRQRGDKTLRIWSAACSRGQEVYSLSMCIHRFIETHAPDLRYSIWGTDVDEKSVILAQNGVYLREEIKEVPMSYLGNHWARGQGEISEYVKAKKSIKSVCSFNVFNLLEMEKNPIAQTFDIIFCRNVFIYFSHEQVEKLARGFMQRLTPEGQLFVGISESLRGLGLPVHALGPSIYAHEHKALPQKLAPTPQTSPVRVLCVDDSPSILLLLKKILTREFGFEIVATAVNGADAHAKMKTLKVDLVTLDIHMPVQDGLGYLQEHFGPGHPPVVMVTSVSRDNIDLAHKAIKLGAADFVEKPSLTNLLERADEIRTKLRASLRSNLSTHSLLPSVDKAFESSQSIHSFEHKLRVIFIQNSDLHRLPLVLERTEINAPATILVMNEEPGKFECGRPIEILTDNAPSGPFHPNRIYLANMSQCNFMLRRVQNIHKIALTTSIMIFGAFSAEIRSVLATWPKSQLLIEDKDAINTFASTENVVGHSVEILPCTSFAYVSKKFFSDSEKKGTGGTHA